MNVYEFYLSTCKYVLLADPANKSTWSDLYGYLPCLRQMLSCCVCGNIMLRPKGPSHGICVHHVCASCIGGKMRLRPACSWCRIHDGFIDNPGLRIIVLCFKKMCEYINSSAIGHEIRRAATNGAHTNTLIRVLDEAAAFDDDYVISNKVMPACVPAWGMAPEPKLVSVPRGSAPSQTSKSGSADGALRGISNTNSAASTHSHNSEKEAPPKLASLQTTTASTATIASEKEKVATALKLNKLDDEFVRMPALLAPCTRGISSQEKLSPPLPSSRADVHDNEVPSNWVAKASKKPRQPKVKKVVKVVSKKVRPVVVNKNKLKNSVVQQTQIKIKGKYKKKPQKAAKPEIDFEPPCKRTRLASSLNGHIAVAVLARKICKCARLNAPSRLTCFGQRCPCYSSRLPCVSCLCRGCRNPRKDHLLLRTADEESSECEHDPSMPRLSPEPRT